MRLNSTLGRIHSFQSMGTLDGPGVRFVVFFQGCNLRCGCCHNPDTWDFSKGNAYTVDEIINKVIRYKEYFGDEGGITVSGGEPLLQAGFVYELFNACHAYGINTCLDTSGCILNGEIEKLLDVTDRVLLDIKYTTEEYYTKYVGCEYGNILSFLSLLERKSVPTTIRQVIIPTLTDTRENILALNEIVKSHKNVDKIELLPFKKICQTKYDSMNIDFPFKNIPTPSVSHMKELELILKEIKKPPVMK